MLRQYLDDTTAFGTRSHIPLRITTAVIKNGVQFVRNEFVGRENPERFGVPT